jgi:hypothetical protein
MFVNLSHEDSTEGRYGKPCLKRKIRTKAFSWSDLYYILLQNQGEKVKLFFAPTRGPKTTSSGSETETKGLLAGGKPLDRAIPALLPLENACYVYPFLEMLV